MPNICEHGKHHRQCCDLNKPQQPKSLKADSGKRRWDLLPIRGVAAVADVMEFGAKKYSEGDWLKGIESARLLAACQRHLYEEQIAPGSRDPESNLSHVAHAAANLLMWEHLRQTRPQ